MVTFVDDAPRGVVVNPERIPYGTMGLPGNILDVALRRALTWNISVGASQPVQPACQSHAGAYLLQ